MSNSIVPGSSADVNVQVRALGTDPNVSVQYKTVILKKNLVNRVNTLTQAMINQTNTKYVIKYDYIITEDIIMPSNCIFDFDGGSFTCEDIYFSDSVYLKNGIINIKGQIHLNINAKLENCKIIRISSMNATDSIIVVKNNELDLTEVNANIKLKNCTIEYVLGRQQPLPRAGYAIELFAEQNTNNHSSGYSNLCFDNVLIDGYFTSAVYIHTTGIGWVTDVLFNYIIITRAYNAFVIYSDYQSNSRIQAIRITNSSIQGMTQEDGYFLDCYNARNIYVYNSIPWDWNDYVNRSAFKFYSNTGYVYIDNILGGSKNYDFVDLTNTGKKRNDFIHINNTSDYDLVKSYPNGNGNPLSSVLNLSSDVKLVDFVQIPEGVYSLPEDNSICQHLGLGGAQGGVLICKNEYKAKIIIYIGNIRDDNKRREVAFMSLLTYQSYNANVYVKDYWIRPLLLEDSDNINNVNIKLKQYDITTYIKAAPVNYKHTSFNNFPTNWGNKWLGERLFDSNSNRPAFWEGSSWKDVNGFTYNPIRGTTALRLTLNLESWDNGYCYYDTDLNKPVWWNGTKWIKADGTDADA